MKTALFILALANNLVSSLILTGAYPELKQIISFGDDLSDKGNYYELSNFNEPSNKVYYKGRFSNGMTWAESLGARMNLDINSYAYGFATTDNKKFKSITKGKKLKVPGCLQQVNNFITEYTNNRAQFSKPKYMLATFAFNQLQTSHGGSFRLLDGYATVDSLKECIETLLKGVPELTKVMVVSSSYPKEYFPALLTVKPDSMEFLDKFWANKREAWATAKTLIKKDNENVDLYDLDLEEFIRSRVDGTSPVHFSRKIKGDRSMCIEGDFYPTKLRPVYCKVWNDHLFWDPIHLTSTIHDDIAKYAAYLLEIKYDE